MSQPCSSVPALIVDDVRARIAPLFPDWESHRVEALVCQIAEVQWRYQVGSESEMRQHYPDPTRHVRRTEP